MVVLALLLLSRVVHTPMPLVPPFSFPLSPASQEILSSPGVELHAPKCDYTPAPYITLLFTDLGVLTPVVFYCSCDGVAADAARTGIVGRFVASQRWARSAFDVNVSISLMHLRCQRTWFVSSKAAVSDELIRLYQ